MNELVEQALWSLAVDDAQPVELRHPALVGAVLKDSEEMRWFGVVQALALHRDRPIRGGLSVDALRRALRNHPVDEEPAGGVSAGSYRRPGSPDLYVVLEFLSEGQESALAAAQRLALAQSADDDFGRNPLSEPFQRGHRPGRGRLVGEPHITDEAPRRLSEMSDVSTVLLTARSPSATGLATGAPTTQASTAATV